MSVVEHMTVHAATVDRTLDESAPDGDIGIVYIIEMRNEGVANDFAKVLDIADDTHATTKDMANIVAHRQSVGSHPAALNIDGAFAGIGFTGLDSLGSAVASVGSHRGKLTATIDVALDPEIVLHDNLGI